MDFLSQPYTIIIPYKILQVNLKNSLLISRLHKPLRRFAFFGAGGEIQWHLGTPSPTKRMFGRSESREEFSVYYIVQLIQYQGCSL